MRTLNEPLPLIRLSPVHLIVTLAAAVLGTILGGVATGLLAGCLCISPAIIDPQTPKQKGDNHV